MLHNIVYIQYKYNSFLATRLIPISLYIPQCYVNILLTFLKFCTIEYFNNVSGFIILTQRYMLSWIYYICGKQKCRYECWMRDRSKFMTCGDCLSSCDCLAIPFLLNKTFADLVRWLHIIYKSWVIFQELF